MGSHEDGAEALSWLSGFATIPNLMEPRRTEQAGVDDEVLTVQEVAKFLKVTPKTVYEIIKQGSLPSFRVGRAVRCRRSAVDSFIEEQARGAVRRVGEHRAEVGGL